MIDKEFATQAAFTAFRAIRDAVLNVPARVKEELAAHTDANELEQQLERELTAALHSLNLEALFTEDDLE